MTRIRLAQVLYLLHGCPQSCVPNPVEGLLEVCEDMIEVLLVIEIDYSVYDVTAGSSAIVLEETAESGKRTRSGHH